MKLDNQCGAYIKHINDALQKNCNNVLQKNGLTLSQLIVLYQLEEVENGTLSLKELERKLQVAQPTAAGIIARMEQKGLVESAGSAEDKRIKMVHITEEGRACFEDSQKHAIEAEERLLSFLTQEERIQLRGLLKKVSEKICE